MLQQTHFHEVVKLVKEHCVTEDGQHYLSIRCYGLDSKMAEIEFFFHSPQNANKKIPIENRNTLSYFNKLTKKGD